MTALLSTTYFGPVQWYQKLYRYEHVLMEVHETFTKQTYRNRCLIATTQGVQALTVPISHPDSAANNIQFQSSISNLQSICLSNHGHWQHQHWQAITSAYGDSPFLPYYEDDLRPFFFETGHWERLIDYNEAIRQKICELLDIHPHVEPTKEYVKSSGFADYRDAIRPKQPPIDPDFKARPYYQVFSQRHGFLPNLSILDLLLNMGPESIYFL